MCVGRRICRTLTNNAFTHAFPAHPILTTNGQIGWCEFLERIWKSGVWVVPRNRDDAVCSPVTAAAETESHIRRAQPSLVSDSLLSISEFVTLKLEREKRMGCKMF